MKINSIQLLTLIFVLFNAFSSMNAQTIQFTAFGKLCYSNNVINLDNYVNLKNGKWELIDIDGKKSGTSEYAAATSQMIDSTRIKGNYPGKYYWRYRNYNNGSPLADSVYMTINALPDLTAIRDPAPKCFDDGKFDLTAKFPVGCNLDSTTRANADVWFTMSNSQRDTMIKQGTVGPHWYYTERFFNNPLSSTPGYDHVVIHVQDKITGCNDSVLFKVKVNPNPVVGLRNITVCQDAGSFRVNPVLVAAPNNPDAGIYTWEIDSAPAGLTAQDKKEILEDRNPSPWFKEYWFNPFDFTFPVSNPANANRVGCYKLKFCYTDGATNCETCDYTNVCVEALPKIKFTAFDKFCYSDDTIFLDDYVNLTNGRWELKSFNGFSPSSPAYNAAKARMIDSTKINIIDTPAGKGGVYCFLYINESFGYPIKDSVEMFVNARPLLAVSDLDTICLTNGSIDLLNQVTTPTKTTFMNGGAKTGWYGTGVSQNTFYPDSALPKNYFPVFSSPIILGVTYQNPNTLCTNRDSISVVIENRFKFNKGIYRIDDYFYANESEATYQWIDCNNSMPILEETNRAFTPTKNGRYAVMLTTGNCNTDTSVCVEMKNVSVHHIANSDIQVYPNPVKEVLYIKNNASSTLLLNAALYGSDGKLLKTFDANELNQAISFQYPKGMYWLQITTTNGLFIQKLVK